MFRSLKLSAPAHFYPPGGEEELEIELMIDHAYYKASIKILEDGVWKVSGLMNTSRCREGGTLQLHGDGSFCTRNPPYLEISLHLAVHLYSLSYPLI